MDEAEVKGILGQHRVTPDEVIDYGLETAVVVSDHLPFVVKFPYPESAASFTRTKRRYQQAAEVLGGDIALFSVVPNLRLHDKERPLDLPEAIIQEKVQAVSDRFLDTASEEEVMGIVRQVADLEKRVMGKGRYPYDNLLLNMGRAHGQVVLLDLGDVLPGLRDKEDVKDATYRPRWPASERHIFNRRGFVIYERYLKLKGEWDMPLAAEAYQDALGFKLSGQVRIDPEALSYLFWKHHRKISRALQRALPQAFEEFRDYADQAEWAEDPLRDFCTSHGKASILAYNVMLRNEYDREFVAIAREEYRQHFRQGSGQKALPFLSSK